MDGIHKLTHLMKLTLDGCIALQNVDDLSGIPWLHTIRMEDCTALTSLAGLRNLPKLDKLYLRNCKRLPLESYNAIKVVFPKLRFLQ